VTDVIWPSIPAAPPPYGPSWLSSLFWEPSELLSHPDHRGSETSYPNEAWFFVNGILTNDEVARLNAAYLADVFHRPLTIVQNATSSLWLDLTECAAGKQWHRTTESVRTAFPAIHQALKSRKTRVVVVAHSQGTIIMSVVLRLLKDSVHLGETRARATGATMARLVFPPGYPVRLEEFEPLAPQELAKLEIYCFANCANTMTYYAPAGGAAHPVPWIESFGNEFDIVARLGMQAPQGAAHGIDISGPNYVRRGAWGHLLNEHYLAPLDAAQREGRRRGGRGGSAPYELTNPDAPHDDDGPRLFRYINGGTPVSGSKTGRARPGARGPSAVRPARRGRTAPTAGRRPEGVPRRRRSRH
jgi:hypothetical protein